MGEPVVTIGNPFDLTETLTSGIVSQTNRFVDIEFDQQGRWVANLIQFDAAVNSGNSGSPLLNSEGEVIGMVIARVNPTREMKSITLSLQTRLRGLLPPSSTRALLTTLGLGRDS